MSCSSSLFNEFYDYLTSRQKTKIYLSDELEYFLLEKKQYDENVFEKELDRLNIFLQKKFNNDLKINISSTYTFSDAEKYVLLRSDLKAADPEEKRKIEKIIKNSQDIEKKLRSLSWLDFEKICTEIFKEFGADFTTTKCTGDDGIDGYGFYSIKSTCAKNRLEKELKIRIIIQAKHFKSGHKGIVDHGKVSSFILEFISIKNDKRANDFKIFDRDFLNAPYPLIPIFMSNGGYQPKSRKKAEEQGLILWEGKQLVQDLSEYDSKILKTIF